MSDRHTPTDEQQAILDNREDARVRIVTAAPGSGKTWLMGEIVRAELASWNGGGGLAALSFTRVARDAIAEALGGRLPDHPHFVGTLDSFAHRFVLRAFGRAIADWMGDLRLVPAEVARRMGEKWNKQVFTIAIGSERPSLFEIHPERIEGGVIRFIYKSGYMRSVKVVPDDMRIRVLKRKSWLWKQVGVASHSDVALLCWHIVTHEKFGPLVRSLLTQRFPMLMVDEVQDTGWFLGSMVHALLSESATRGVIVGDHDQSIYEFAGALPEDFDRFGEIDGAHAYPMRTSFRCPAKVCRVASHLSWQGASVTPAEGATQGSALLLVYELVPKLEELCASIEAELGVAPATVLSRSQAGLQKIVGSAPKTPEFHSPALRHIWEATIHFRRGDARKASAAAAAALNHIAFGATFARTNDLMSLGHDEESWRALSIAALIRAAALPTTSSAFDWGIAAKEVLLNALRELVDDKDVSKRIKNPQAKTKDVPAAVETDVPGSARRCATVHGAKGESHEITLLFVRKCNSNRCPATTWFSKESEHAEERRVAFVAVSRPRHALVLLVHTTTYDRLSKRSPKFVDEFEVRRL